MHARRQFCKLADPTSIETARYIAKRGILRRGTLSTHLRNFPTTQQPKPTSWLSRC